MKGKPKSWGKERTKGALGLASGLLSGLAGRETEQSKGRLRMRYGDSFQAVPFVLPPWSLRSGLWQPRGTALSPGPTAEREVTEDGNKVNHLLWVVFHELKDTWDVLSQ